MAAAILPQGSVLCGGKSRTADEISERAARAASALDALGVGTGDEVALLLRNDFAFFEATAAAGLLGAHAVPINWHFSAREVNYVLEDSGAKVIIIHADLHAALEMELPAGVHVFLVETPPEILDAYDLEAQPPDRRNGLGVHDWDTVLRNHEPWTGPAMMHTGSIIYTSGTTGKPKGVRRPPFSEERTRAAIGMACAMYGFQPGEPFTTVMTGPMYHAGPNGYALLCLRLGATVILQPRFRERELLSLIGKYRVTHLHMVPTMFVRLIRIPLSERDSYDLSSLKWVSHGAAPCPPRVKAAMIEWWGPVINEYYGSTETGGITVQRAADVLAKPGSVGKSIPGVEVQIRDEEGARLGPGEVGNVWVRSSIMGDFTYHQAESNSGKAAPNKYVWVGDVGYFDEDGYLFLCDRRCDIINSGGVNIYSAEIEAALLELESVVDCAVFGIPDDEFGEAVCAHVVSGPGVDVSEEDLQGSLRQKLGRYKVPKKIVFSRRLPRESSGKIFKKKLRDPYWRKTGRLI